MYAAHLAFSTWTVPLHFKLWPLLEAWELNGPMYLDLCKTDIISLVIVIAFKDQDKQNFNTCLADQEENLIFEFQICESV